MEAFYQNWLKKFEEQRQLLRPESDLNREQNNGRPKNPSEVVYENDSFKLFVERAPFRRQKLFRIQDHLFKFKIVQKQKTNSPFLSDLFEFLHAALLHVLESIKTFYNPQDHNVAYLTLHQDPMVNGLNTGMSKFC